MSHTSIQQLNTTSHSSFYQYPQEPPCVESPVPLPRYPTIHYLGWSQDQCLGLCRPDGYKPTSATVWKASVILEAEERSASGILNTTFAFQPYLGIAVATMLVSSPSRISKAIMVRMSQNFKLAEYSLVSSLPSPERALESIIFSSCGLASFSPPA